MTKDRVYFLSGSGYETWEKKQSGHYGYFYVTSEEKAINHIIKSFKIQIETLKIKRLDMKKNLKKMQKKLIDVLVVDKYKNK